MSAGVALDRARADEFDDEFDNQLEMLSRIQVKHVHMTAAHNH